MVDYTDDYTASVANRYKPKTKAYDSGLAARFSNAGKPGYTAFGGLDWDYRGSEGPTLIPKGTEGWSPEQWSDFGAKGGTISDTGATVYPGQKTGSDWGSSLRTGAAVIGGLSDAMTAYTAYKALKLGEKQFDHTVALDQVNLENSGNLINTAKTNSATVGMSLAGDTLTPAQKEAGLAAVKANYVRTAI